MKLCADENQDTFSEESQTENELECIIYDTNHTANGAGLVDEAVVERAVAGHEAVVDLTV
jgi:hypothetical protein